MPLRSFINFIPPHKPPPARLRCSMNIFHAFNDDSIPIYSIYSVMSLESNVYDDSKERQALSRDNFSFELN